MASCQDIVRSYRPEIECITCVPLPGHGPLCGLTGSTISETLKLKSWGLNGVSSFTSPGYVWGLLGQFSVPSAQRWPKNIQVVGTKIVQIENDISLKEHEHPYLRTDY